MATMRTFGVVFLPISILCIATPAAGQADLNFEPAAANGYGTCPTPVANFAGLHDAVACGGDGCANSSCGTIFLNSYDGFAYGPPEAGLQLPVLRNVTVTAAGHVLWKLGDDAGEDKAVNVHQGTILSLRDISVETDPTMSTEAFLLPTDVNLAGAGSSLLVENVTLLTTRDVVHDVLRFARDNLFSKEYRETKLPSGEDAVIIEEYATAGLTAREVTVSHWDFPKDVDTEDLRSQDISDPSRFVLALRNWDVVQSDQLDIVTDLLVDESLFVTKGRVSRPQIVIDRNVTVMGQRRTHANFEKVPLLDLGLLQGAVKVERGATVKFKNLELANLALGPIDLHYGFLMWFLDFDRTSNETMAIIHDSTMVVSCREMEHLRYAIALLNDPLQTLLDQLPNLSLLNSSDWNISLSNAVIVEKGKAFGLELQRVNITCKQSHGTSLDVDFMLDSPLVTANHDPVPPPRLAVRRPSRNAPSSSNSLGTGSTLFKVGLGVLVPCIVVLVSLLVWKCHRNINLKSSMRSVLKNDSEMQLKDYETEAEIETPNLRIKDKKTIKRSFTNSFDHNKFDQLPALSNDGSGRLDSGLLKLAPVAIGGSQAAEFIPDILKVSNDIDDKQLVVKELLGQGQNVSVHKGVWRELEVVVKTIVFGGEGNKGFHQQAIREVAITSGLAHPNVVCTYSYDIKRLQAGSLEARVRGLKNKSGLNVLETYTDWKLFIIQEYCDQGTLQAALKDRVFVRTKGPDLKCLLEIAMGIAKGMHHLHSKNILHGNLKPSNVLLKTARNTHTGMQAKIADFGLSLKMNSEQTHVSNAQQSEPFYMAREVIEEGCATKAADVYAFGVVLWEMHMSQLSPSGKPTEEMFARFPRLPWSCPAMYGVLAAVCMHPVPSARPKFSDCLSFLQTLWHQQRLGALTPGSGVSPRDRCSDGHSVHACVSPKLDGGEVDSQQMGCAARMMEYAEFQETLKKRRAYFQKCLAMMPSMFRCIEYEAVFWAEE